jgi:hypothetical protein
VKRAHGGNRLTRSVATLVASVLIVGVLGSAVAILPEALTPAPAGATNAHTASWSSGPTCNSWANATAPAGTVSATLTLSGPGGGGGNNKGGAAGAKVVGSFSVSPGTAVSVDLGCGGSGSGTTSCSGPQGNAPCGGAGYTSGGNGGTGGGSSSPGGGGGGGSALCFGTSGCTT